MRKDKRLKVMLSGKNEQIAVLAVSILGLVLRLYQLGNDGFWFDEIGVAMAIRSSNFTTLLDSVRSHVMAMPLDYVAGWFFTRSCQSEACFRLPAALWGALSIPVSYFLFKHFTNYKTAILGSLLLSISPIHLQYSQELRFYAPLICLYLLSTLSLFRAIELPTKWRWLVFTLTVIIGSYFHLYVYLSFITGVTWMLFSGNELPGRKKMLAGLLGSFVIASIIILPGYLLFRAGTNYGLFSLAETVVNIMIGFGWLPSILFPLQPGFIWYPLFLFFQFAGYWAVLKSRNKLMLSWLFSSLLQFGIILLVNVITNYAFRGRQLLIIVPMLCMITAKGIIKVYQEGHRLFEESSQLHPDVPDRKQKLFRYIFPLTVIFVGILVSVFSLQSYYHLEKSRRREISMAIVQKWKPGETVWSTPDWEENFYGFYLNFLGYPEIENALIGVENIRIPPDASLPICWITNARIPTDQSGLIEQTGFKIVAIQADFVPDTHLLWCR